MILEWGEEQDGQVKFGKKVLKKSVVSTLSRVHKTKKAKKEAFEAHFMQAKQEESKVTF